MKDITRSFLATAIIQAVNILSGIMLARILLVEGRGNLAAAMLWPGVIASLGVLGIHEAVIYHASRRSGEGGSILYSALLLGAALSIVSAGAAFIAIDIALAGYPAEVVRAAQLYIVFIPLNFVGLCMVGLFQGTMRLNEWNVLRVLVHVGYTALIGVFYLAGWATVTGLAAAALLSNVILIVTAAVLMRPRGWLRPSRPALTRDLFTFGTKAHASSIVQILADRLDQLFISVAIGSAGLGLFIVALTVARLTAVPAATFASLVFTKVANAGDAQSQREILGRYLRATLGIIILAAITVAAASPWIVSLFFGPAFDAAAGLVRVLALAALFLGAKAVLGAGLKGMGHPLVVARAEAAGLGFSVLGLAILLPLYGLAGAALAAVLTQLGSLAVMVIDGRRQIGGSWRALLRPTARDGQDLANLVMPWRDRAGPGDGG